MSEDGDDAAHMRAALSLGGRGIGETWPYPAVGCVIAHGARVVGRGRTATGGRPHAETEALAMAGGAARRDLVRELRLNPYRAEILFRQAMAWEPTELQTALESLLEVDLASKGLAADARHGAGGMSGPLALALWLAEQVPPR
jgi:hypothetical protein